ncbi:hypothetical protein [Collimonas humicola]|uniref:hypothetical protein n=1 Tax=Collimonas humicola TaxID=2825886 RepID=UPI001B8AD5B1|nr:hypothetical protein [Collimonas humicola]
MLDWFTDRLHIGLSRQGIAVLHAKGGRRPSTTVLADHAFATDVAASPEQLLDEVRQVLANIQCPRLPTSVVLSNDWARFWTVTPPVNAVRLSDCQAAAQLRFQALFDAPLTGWQMAADWQIDAPFLACAIPDTLLSPLLQVTSAYRLRLIEVAPQFIIGWNRWRSALQAGVWFGVTHDDTITFAAMDKGQLCTMRSVTRQLRDRERHGWLQEQLTREALRLQLPAPSAIQLCGHRSTSWSSSASDDLAVRWLGTQPVHAGHPSPSTQVILAHTGVRR